MREHMGLFRGKRWDGAWVYGYLYAKPILEKYFIISDENQWLVDPDTLGECASMCDKNGKLIFEGDILKGMRGLHRVYYDTSLACFEWAKINGNWEESFSGFADEYEIIGNVHDNPELLEGAIEKK